MEIWLWLVAIVVAVIDSFILGAIFGPSLLERIFLALWEGRHRKKR